AGEVGVTEITHLSGPDEVVEGGERLFDRGGRVGRVDLVEVDVVGAEVAQRILDGPDDVAPPTPGIPVEAVRAAGIVAELGRHDRLVAPLPESCPEGQ